MKRQHVAQHLGLTRLHCSEMARFKKRRDKKTRMCEPWHAFKWWQVLVSMGTQYAAEVR